MLKAILLKNFRRAYHAKALIVYDLVSVAFNSLLFYGISRFVQPQNGADYALFVIPALGARELMIFSLSASRVFIDREAQEGTLEQLALSTPPLVKIVFYESLWPIGKGLMSLVLYLAASHVIGDAAAPRATLEHFPLILSGFLLVAAQFWALGLLSGGLGLVSRRGHFVNDWITLAVTLLGGTYFPTSVLPSWLRAVGQVSVLEAFNNALRGQGSWSALGLNALIAVPLALACLKIFDWCLNRARAKGTLVL